MVENIPHIPTIFKEIAARISTTFSSRDEDPFEVLFNHGLMAQVAHDINAPITSPLIWLVMPYLEDRQKPTPGKYCRFTGQVIILMPTDTDYTQDDRDEKVFLPRLIPLYKELLKEISATEILRCPGEDRIPHVRRDWPYWGGGENHLANTDNLFKQKVDAIQLNNLSLDVLFSKDCNTLTI